MVDPIGSNRFACCTTLASYHTSSIILFCHPVRPQHRMSKRFSASVYLIFSKLVDANTDLHFVRFACGNSTSLQCTRDNKSHSVKRYRHAFRQSFVPVHETCLLNRKKRDNTWQGDPFSPHCVSPTFTHQCYHSGVTVEFISQCCTLEAP
jgi:hypothetical protein